MVLEDQIIKWRYRLPELTEDESEERIVTAVEVKEELDEHKDTVQSRRTTPVTGDLLNQDTWSPMEQAIWTEMARLAQEVPRLYTLIEKLHEKQKAQEKQVSGLRASLDTWSSFLTR